MTQQPKTPSDEVGHPAPSHRQRQRTYIAWLLALAGVALLGIGAWNWYQRYRYLHRPVTAVNSQHTVTFSTDQPAETPFDCDTYKVPANQPRRITIRSIGVDGCLQKVGIDQNNRVGVPQNINLGGWYTNSARPGDPGVSLIDGHVQGYYNPGIFKRLSQVKPGDQIVVQRGDDTGVTFVVKTVHTYSVDDASAYMLAGAPGIPNQLNLITCGGRYNATSKQYEQRTVVVASKL